MNIKPIKTDADYRAALKEVEALMMAEPNTPEGEKLDVLVTLIEAFERKHFPLDLPDPIEAIKFEMEQKGLQVIDCLSVKGRDTFGPYKLLGGINKGHPDLKDLYNAELFAHKILSVL